MKREEEEQKKKKKSLNIVPWAIQFPGDFSQMSIDLQGSWLLNSSRNHHLLPQCSMGYC